MNPAQLVAGVGEFDAFTLIATLVPDGVRAVHDIAPHVAVPPASNTRERNVPDAAYGVTRIQSTVMAPEPVVKSLASASIGPAIATACVATTVSSTEKTMLVAFQSIRYRCGAPSNAAPSGVAMSVPLTLRADSWPPLIVVKT